MGIHMKMKSKAFAHWQGDVKGRKAGESTLAAVREDGEQKRLILAHRDAEARWALHRRMGYERCIEAWKVIVIEKREERERAAQLAREREQQIELARAAAESMYSACIVRLQH